MWDLLPRPEAWEAWSDRGFRYGMSVFETIAIAEGRPLFLVQHLGRLVRGAVELLGFDARAVAEAAARLPLATLGTGVLRLYVSAGPGGPGDPVVAPAAGAMFEEAPVLAGPGTGVSLLLDAAIHCATPGGWKTGNYWANLRALQGARARGADEAVLFGPGGTAVGCACANLFVMHGGALLTPARACGARDGVVREWILGREHVEEALLQREDVLAADEVFLTNSRVGIAAVASVEGRLKTPFPTAERLAAAYASSILHA